MTRQGCHVCDNALGLLRSLGHDPELVDVDADDHMHNLYEWRVPVLLRGGVVVAEGKMTSEQLEGAVGRPS